MASASKGADPDGKISFTALFAQDDDTMLGHQADAHAIDHNFNHSRLLLSTVKELLYDISHSFVCIC